MKLCCDVCGKGEATLFCSADEAALCEVCDRRFHPANKLATEHSRFSLLNPSFKDSPLCDICQERRAFLFCQEDRAILCKECDLSIHRVNEQTRKHNRFLLTGVKLSSSSSLYSTSSSSSNGYDAAMIGSSETKTLQSSSKRFRSSSVSNNNNGIFSSPSSIEKVPLPSSTTTTTTYNRVEDNYSNNSETASISTSSISEYLIETLPGWRVDDFLHPSFPRNEIR